MYKQKRRLLKVMISLWICYFIPISFMVYSAISIPNLNVAKNVSAVENWKVITDVFESQESEKVVNGVMKDSFMPDMPAGIIPDRHGALFREMPKIPKVAITEIPTSNKEEMQDQTLEEELQEETASPLEDELPISAIDNRLPGVVYLHIDTNSPEAPIILLEEMMSEDDVLVDISQAINHEKNYTPLTELVICFGKVVYRESGDQPFLGKLMVAEGLVNRFRSGVYGNDALAILQQGGYGVEMDINGGYHVYHSDGKEVFDVPDEDMAALQIALSGSEVSNVILEAATGVRNQQYGLTLGIECYQYGSIYHYAPELVSEKALKQRVINQVPVSIRYVDHVFYGYWINSKYAMDIV